MRQLLLIATAMTACTLFGCEDSQASWTPPEREFREFQDVYPVLMRDCGFHTCHGSEDRHFRIYGPGRARLDEDTRAFAAVTGDEISLSFSLALSMVDPARPQRSLLLRKPLALEAGGAPHEGVDEYGRNIYRTVNDEGYLAIARWVLSTPEP